MLYLIVTRDKYELPLFVGSAVEVAEKAGITLNALYSAISHYEHGRHNTCAYRRVYEDMGKK